MALDPRIALGVQPVQIQSPLEMANQIAGLRAAEQRNALVQMQMREAERALTEQNALRRKVATPGFFDQPDALPSLAGEFGQAGAELYESVAKGRKAAAEAKKSDLETEIAGSKALYDYLGVAKDPRSFSQLRSEAEAMGLDVSRVPQTYDPLWVETTRDGALGYTKYLENLRQNQTLDVQKRQVAVSEGRLAFDKDVEKWKRENPEFDIKDTNLGLVAVNKRTGALKPIIYNGQVVSGAAKSSDPRVDEQNTAFNAKRVLNSAQRIAAAVKRNPEAMSAGALEAAARGVPLIGECAAAFIRSEDRQIVEQNYEGIIDALLFMATGAAYNKEQREATINEIKPLFTDKAGALADKRGKLAEYIEAAKIKSGRAWTPELDQAMNVVLGMYGTPQGETAAGTGPQVGTVENGYRFKGGDPSNPASWEKVK